MSVLKLTRGQRLMGKLGAAAVIAALSTLPSTAMAGKPPTTPPTPPQAGNAPDPQPLTVGTTTNWFADWHEDTAATAPPDFFATPPNQFGVPFMQAQLNGSAAAGRPLGVKVLSPLSLAQSSALFDTKYQPGNRAISYVFGDFEQGTPTQVLSNVSTLSSQVRASSWSRNAYVGQWDLTPLDRVNDRFYRTPGAQVVGSLSQPWGRAQYNSAKLNMANTQLYPGTADYRNRSTNDWQNANIRTGLFIGPIGRETQVQQILDQSYNGLKTETGRNNHKQIPWVARFNNAGNNSLNNAGGGAYAYAFQPGQPLPQAGLSGSETANQMLGRGDFSAQIRHHRMRGAYSVNLFEPGVVGYTQQQMQQDVRDGWSGDARLNEIFAAADNKYATMTLNPTIDGTTNPDRAEQTGTIWSGQYSEEVENQNSTAKVKGQTGRGDLMILASNLDTADHLITFGAGDTPHEIFTKSYENGWTYDDGSATAESRVALIEEGMHRMLQFDLVERRVYESLADLNSGNKKYKTQTIWMLNQNYTVFGNNDRNQMGIPEPTTFGSLAAAGAIAVVCRRQRRKVN